MIWRVTLALLCTVSIQSTPQAPVFRAEGRSVVVPVSVKARNVPVTGLTAADFRLWDSGVEQTVTDVGLEDVPIDVTVFLDNSGSTTAYRLEFNENLQTIVTRRSEGVLHIMEVRSAGQSTIAAVPSEPREGPDGHARLRRVAEVTGGTVHAPFLGPNIVQSFMRVYDDFKSSYVLRYTPTRVPTADWHPIKVNVRSSSRLTIRHRQGYAASR